MLTSKASGAHQGNGIIQKSGKLAMSRLKRVETKELSFKKKQIIDDPFQRHPHLMYLSSHSQGFDLLSPNLTSLNLNHGWLQPMLTLQDAWPGQQTGSYGTQPFSRMHIEYTVRTRIFFPLLFLV